GATVFDGTRGRQCRRSHFRPEFGSHCCRRRFLDDLLMSPLDRTFALEDMKVVAVRVAKNLELDMPRPTNVFFDKHPAVAKRSRCFARSRCPGPGQICRTFDQAHSLAAAPARSFDKNWIFGIRRFTLPSRNHGNTRFLTD